MAAQAPLKRRTDTLAQQYRIRHEWARYQAEKRLTEWGTDLASMIETAKANGAVMSFPTYHEWANWLPETGHKH